MLISLNSVAQCVTGSAGGNANLIDNMDGTYQIACDGGNVNISSSTFDNAALPPSAIQWTSGQTGDFAFTPDCNNLGCFEFTPCVPTGTTIPQQCVPFNSLGVPLTGTVSAGSSQNITFNIAGICYVPGATYSGDLGINLSGSGSVSLSVVQPDGVVQGPLTFDISLINSLSPLPLSLLGLSVDPNGTWSITLQDAGAGSFGYTIDPNSQICIDAIATQGVQCGDPIEVCVVEGCPTFVSAQASETQICSGETFDLSATLNPSGATNVTYNWTGNGITNPSSASPSVTVSNTTCAAVTETYNLTLTCTNDGSTIVSNQAVNVTVFPEVDASQVVIDNTTNTADPNCSIAVSYPPCPAFTISGNTSFSPGDNGTTVNYIVSNGNANCDVTVSSLVNCIGNCVPAAATVVTSACDANGNFTIDVTINSLGNSNSIDIILSDGSSQTGLTSVGGTYTFGPFASGTSINVKLIDPNDPTCNVNLGEFTENCFTCPNLTSLSPLAANVCGGDAINLVAAVDQGTEGIDYSIQWYENGVAIVGGNTANYMHIALAADPCNINTYSYSAELICLNNGLASTTNTLSAGSVNVYHVPVEGIDFVFENCSATPIDNCGNLTINIGGATDPAPGSSTTVNYTIGVAGAPATCQATGAKSVNCPSCPDRPGNGAATETVLCWDDSVDFSNTSSLVSSLGYEVGYVITPNPPSSYPSTNALLAASLNGVNGAFPAPGNIPAQTYTNDGSLFTPTDPCGEVLYFTPFLSFACQSYQASNQSGVVETPPGTDFIAGIYQTPGLSGVTLSVPQVPYCNGLVSYDLQLCVDDQTDDGAGLFGLCFAGEDPLQMNSLFGLINGLPGGGFSNFPNINNIHDSQQNVCYNQNGWNTNPSGEQINLVTVNLQDFCAGGNDSDFMSYDFEVDVICDSTFPTVCADCDVLGAPVAVRFLPQLQTPITSFVELCEGDEINLFNEVPFNINPAANYTVTWLDGNGAVIANPTTVVPPVGFTPYCYEVSYCDDGACIIAHCLDVIVEPKPVVNAPTLGPICAGEAFDLTSVEASIATGGTVNWSIGGIINSGGAAIANPNSVIPIGSELYCAEFTDNITGCVNTVCASFTFEAKPTLFSTNISVCEGDAIDLVALQPQLTTAAGTFTWYNGDPATGGTPIANPSIAIPMNGDVYCAVFSDGTNGCEATVCITPTVNALPITTDYAPPIACDSDAPYDLTQYESLLGAGTFTWYNADPAAGGTVINAAALNQAVGITTYWFELTDPTTGCAVLSTMDFEVEQCCATVDLRIFFDGFPFQTSWDITDANGNVVASSGGTYSGQPGTNTININQVACLPDGCYDLNFYDLIGNGMCPFRSSANAVGTFITPGTVITPGSIVGTFSIVTVPGLCGNYTLSDANGTPLVNGGGAFGSLESTNFCLSGGLALRVKQTEEDKAEFVMPKLADEQLEQLETPIFDFEVLPTVADNRITINYQTDEDVYIRIVDLNGKVWREFTQNESAFINQVPVDVTDFTQGLYFVQIIQKDGVATKKFIKR